MDCPSTTGKTPAEAIANYGFESWIAADKALAKRWLDDNTIAYLFQRNKRAELFAVIVAWSPWAKAYDVQDDWVGPFESVDDFETCNTTQTLW